MLNLKTKIEKVKKISKIHLNKIRRTNNEGINC